MAITHCDSANNPNSEYTSKTTYTELSVTLLDSDRWTGVDPPPPTPPTVNAKPVCSGGVAQVKLFILPLIEPFIKMLLCSYANKT